MPPRSDERAPAGRLRLPRGTARLRLTLVYAGLFLLSGTCVLALVYALAARSATVNVSPVPVGQLAAGPTRVPRPPRAGVFIVPPAQLRLRVVQPAQIHEGVVAQHAADVGRLLEVSWLALALTTVASALLGWIAAGRVLRPLRAITTTARTISAGNLHARLALTGPDDEFRQLGDTLDELLGRLEGSFEAQRRFVANASHELRTPLTLERTLLQVALADPNATAAALRSTCEELLTNGEEHERLLEALLTLASSERGLEHREPLDLSRLAEQVMLTPPGEIERLSLQLDLSLATAPTSGDPALLHRLMANLIDNAAGHNVAGGRIKLETGTRGDQAMLVVTNSGPPVPPGEIERLLEPFQRLGADRSAGTSRHHGLGLSIVRAIADAHNATLMVRAQPEGGLAITIRFPRSDNPRDAPAAV